MFGSFSYGPFRYTIYCERLLQLIVSVNLKTPKKSIIKLSRKGCLEPDTQRIARTQSKFLISKDNQIFITWKTYKKYVYHLFKSFIIKNAIEFQSLQSIGKALWFPFFKIVIFLFRKWIDPFVFIDYSISLADFSVGSTCYYADTMFYCCSKEEEKK